MNLNYHYTVPQNWSPHSTCICVKKAKSEKKKQASVTISAEPEGTALYDRDSDASTGSY